MTNTDRILVDSTYLPPNGASQFIRHSSFVIRYSLLLFLACRAAPSHSRAETLTNLLDGVYVNAGNTYAVGESGPFNVLVLTNGARLDDTVGVIGAAANASSNTVLVTAPDSLWNNAIKLAIGQSGSANQLVITDGAHVLGGAGVLGQEFSSSNNRVRVTGAGSYLYCPAELHVGEAGSGNQLYASDGGAIYSGGRSAIGYSALSSNNLATLTGAGVGWFNSFEFYIGLFGSAHNRCLISDGATLVAPSGAIGSGPNNYLMVSGPGSHWQNERRILIGNEGENNLLIVTNGGRVSCVNAWIAGGTNRAIVAGANSVWDTGNSHAQLVVGEPGFSNQLAILDGGRVNSFDGIVTSSNNLVTVHGANSFWNISDTLILGEDFGRSNQLSISSGGQVSAGEVTIAGDAGLLLVTGTGTSLTANALLGIGGDNGADNRLSIEAGGRVSSLAGYLGGLTTSYDPYGRNVNNRALISGPGSFWTNAAELVVGSTGTSNQLVIADGAQVHNAAAYLGLFGISANNGAQVSGSNALWHSRNDLFVGYASPGNRLSITNGGRIRCANGAIGRNYNRNNSAEITSPGSLWQVDGTLIVGNSGYQNQMTIAQGGRVTCAQAYIDAPSNPNPGTSNSVLVTGANSLWSIASTLAIGVSSPASQLRVENGGTVSAQAVTLGSPTLPLNGSILISNGNFIVTNSAGPGILDIERATVTLNGGTVTVDQLLATAGPQSFLNFNGGVLNVQRSVAIANGRSLAVGNGAAPAQFLVKRGSHAFADGLRVLPNAVLAIAGNVTGSITNAGTLNVGGATADRLTVSGNLRLSDEGQVRFDLGGPSQGTQYDFMQVSNAVQLGGRLRVGLIGGFVPASNAVFTLMQFASKSGSFLNAPSGARLGLEGSSISARVDYSGNTLRLLEFQAAGPAMAEIDDAWAAQYFGHAPLTEQEKESDTDGDGLSNAAEYLAGTSPVDPASVLKILTPEWRGPSQLALQFQCVSGKMYGIYYSSDLHSWQEVTAPLWQSLASGLCEWVDDGSQTGGFPAGTPRFYRVMVK
jgi:T5SS/PEP-CTERM-associated repeat protein